MKKLILFLSIFIAFNLTAQNVGIGTNTPKDLSKLDIESNTSGFLLPRMNTAQRATLGGNVSALGAILSAEYNGLMVFDTDNLTLYMWDSNKSDFANGGWNNVLDADASVNDADADPNNELQTITKSGSTVTLSDGGGSFTDDNTTYDGTDFVISGQGVIAGNFVTGADGGGAFTYAPDNVTDADADPNNEFQTISQSGTNVTLSNGGGTVSVADNDNNSSNEIQTLSKSGSTVTLSNGGGSFTDDNTTYNGTDFVISGQGAIAGNFVTGADGGGAFTYAPDNVNDADSNPNNEIQNLSSSASGTNRTINISSGTGTTINVADNDNSSTNEIQALSISGSTVSLSNGGGSVVVPSSADNLGNHSATTNLDMNGNAINEALEINSSGDHFEFMRNRIDDNTYEWLGFYSGGTRQGIFLYDGAWTGANSLTNEFSLTAENNNKLTLNTSGNSDIALMPKGTGNVGVGTLNPTQKFEVFGNIRSTGNYFINNDSPTIYLQDNNHNSGMIHMNSDLMYFLSANGINSTSWATNGSLWPLTINMANDVSTFGGETHFLEGNVGIGTAAPSQALHVQGNTRVSGLGGSGNQMVVTDNNGVLSTQALPTGDNLGNHTATTNLNMGNREVDNINFLDLRPGNGYGLRFWSSDSYKIHMGSAAEYQYGPVSDYSIKTNMNSTDNIRGWTWGVNGVTPVAAINTEGHMALRGSLFLDCAECGSTTEAYPTTGGAYGDMLIQGRVLSTNSNLHLSPPGGSDVIINTTYRGAGGATGVANLVVDDGRVYTNSAGSTSNRSALAHDITGLFDGAAGFSFSQRGVVISSDEFESGGFQGNGNNANIWSPGDADLVRFYDEDGMNLRAYIDGFSGAYVQASDINKKQNINRLDNSLSKLLSLKGYTYEFKLHEEEIEKGQKPVLIAGVIAQEVQKVMPEVVQDHGEDGLYVNYDALIPYLIEGMKEQQNQIEELKGEMENQQLQINKLEQLVKK